MLTRKLAVQALADERAGLVSPYRTAQFPEPFRTLRVALKTLGPQACEREWLMILLDAPDGRRILEELSAAQVGAGGEALFQPLAEIAGELPAVTWLWPGWIPRGFISLLGAAPGAGKSLVALDLARRVITGDAWPDGQGWPDGEGGGPVAREPGRVIYVDAEAVPQLAAERAAAWGMDTRRLFMLLPEEGRFFVDFSAAPDRDRLTEMVYALDPALIVVDSLSSITSTGENAVDDVRGVLGFLNSVAQIQPCGLLLIHHLRKRGTGALPGEALTLDDFRGSSHIVAMSRSVLGLSRVRVGPTVDANGPRRLEVVKTNLGPHPEPLGVAFEPLPPRGVRLVYGAPAPEYRELSLTEGCAIFLERLLAKGPLPPSAVVEAAREAGYSRDVLYRARRTLEGRVVSTAGRQNPDNRWVLVDVTAPGSREPTAG